MNISIRYFTGGQEGAMRNNADDIKPQKVYKSPGFLEALILDANDKFFEIDLIEGLQSNSENVILYNTVIHYFKSNS